MKREKEKNISERVRLVELQSCYPADGERYDEDFELESRCVLVQITGIEIGVAGTPVATRGRRVSLTGDSCLDGGWPVGNVDGSIIKCTVENSQTRPISFCFLVFVCRCFRSTIVATIRKLSVSLWSNYVWLLIYTNDLSFCFAFLFAIAVWTFLCLEYRFGG